MALPRIGGPGFGLNLNGAYASQLPLLNVGQTAAASQFAAGAVQADNAVTLPSGGVFYLPAGTFYIEPGLVTSLQFLDPVTQIWRTINSTPNAGGFNVDADGGNVRLANLSGTVVGALITNVGTAMTNGVGSTVTGLTITPSTGGSVWIPVVGGTNSTAAVITTAGSNYAFAPLLVVSPPPAGGVQATAICTVAGGSVATVAFINQGAGYTAPPTITVLNDYRDTTGSGAVITPGPLTGSGTLTAMYPSGAQQTAFSAGVGGNGLGGQTSVPTFTFSAGSTISATAIMNFCITGLTVTGGGSGIPAGSMLMGNPTIVAGARAAGLGAIAPGNGIQDTLLTLPRPAWISPSLNAGSVSTTGSTIVDPGFGFQAIPTISLISGTGIAPSTGINITAIVGGQNDTSWVQPF